MTFTCLVNEIYHYYNNYSAYYDIFVIIIIIIISHLGANFRNIEVIPEESSPDDVKLYYDKHDKALRELAADVASYVPANIR